MAFKILRSNPHCSRQNMAHLQRTHLHCIGEDIFYMEKNERILHQNY